MARKISTRRVSNVQVSNVQRLAFGVLVCGALIGILGSDDIQATTTWPGLRGPNFDGSAPASQLFTQGTPGLALGWKVELGSGYSAVVVDEARAITQFAAGDADVIAAFEVATGRELWRYRISETHAGLDGSHDGPISTPALAAGRVYGLGAWGHLFALDAATGRELWKTHLKDDHGASMPHYGFTTSPLVVDDVLVVLLGAGEGKTIAGFRVTDGHLLWTLGNDQVAYQSPVIATLGGRRQVVAAAMKTVWGIDPKTGAELWSFAHEGDGEAMGAASIIPVPAGENRVLLLAKRDAATMLSVQRDQTTWTVTPLWSNNALSSTYVQPVYHQGHLYGIAGRILTCVDAQTGERKWRSRDPGDGFITGVGDHLVIITKAGTLHVVAASPEGYQELANLALFTEHSWSAVAYADGHLFARSMRQLARIDPQVAPSAPSEQRTPWLAKTDFGRFLAELETAADKAAVIDAFLARQTSFPLIEGSEFVHFIYRGPAEDVGIVGDMIGFRREDKMRRVPGTDLFTYSTRLEPTAALTYGFLVDYARQAVADPRNPRPGKGLFGDVSWFAMPAWTPPVFASAPAAQNSGHREDFEWTSALRGGKVRKAQIYLPPGYAADTARRFPTVYIHGGEDSLNQGETAKVLDAVIGSAVAPLIAVFILPDAADPRLDQREEDLYLDMVLKELVPAIDQKYRTLATSAQRASAGTGSYAYFALLAALRQPDVFGKVALQGATLEPAQIAQQLGVAEERPLVIYQEWGTYHLRSPHEAWDLARANRELWALFRERGFKPTGGEVPEGFGWACWRAHTDDWLQTLFPRNPQDPG